MRDKRGQTKLVLVTFLDLLMEDENRVPQKAQFTFRERKLEARRITDIFPVDQRCL